MFKKFLMTIAMAMMVGMAYGADKSTTMRPVLDHGEAMVKYFEDDKNMEIVHIEYDLIFSADNTKTLTRNFSKGYMYILAGFADDRVKDLDLELYRKTSSGDWELVDKDSETDNTPVLVCNVEQSGEYMIRIKAPSFSAGSKAAHYGLIIAHD